MRIADSVDVWRERQRDALTRELRAGSLLGRAFWRVRAWLYGRELRRIQSGARQHRRW